MAHALSKRFNNSSLPDEGQSSSSSSSSSSPESSSTTKTTLLFISDIRSTQGSMSETQQQERIRLDMANQREWHRIMRPHAAMLKFRLPYAHGTTEYLAGEIHLPVFGGRTTSETRLIVSRDECASGSEVPTSASTTLYSHQDYEDLMYHHNVVTRTTYWPHNVKGEGLDHCYDCAAEIFILKQYLMSTDESIIDVNEEIAAMSAAISREISSSGRTLHLAR
eukprot:TRINITY_DN9157_c1_g1_i2.p1 TRINITY_DN9157_c1_g1~~TRINITY_DN9157_c1_g1_i2.p1  ORF type:complete len:246 (+),score=71.43 TRINITY_DN9157_c1_g1_i2:73-738(+)